MVRIRADDVLPCSPAWRARRMRLHAAGIDADPKKRASTRNSSTLNSPTPISARIAGASWLPHPRVRRRRCRMRALRAPDPFIFCLENGAAYVSTGCWHGCRSATRSCAMLLARGTQLGARAQYSIQQEYDAKVRRQADPKSWR